MAKSNRRNIQKPPVADGPQEKKRKPGRRTELEQEGKLRPTKVELKHPAKQRLPEYCRLNALFHDQEKMDAKLKEMMLLCPDSQRGLFFDWLAQSPFDIDPNIWEREKVPSFLGVDNPLDDFTLRLNIILDTVVSDFNRSVVEHSTIPHAEHDFRGCTLGRCRGPRRSSRSCRRR